MYNIQDELEMLLWEQFKHSLWQTIWPNYRYNKMANKANECVSHQVYTKIQKQVYYKIEEIINVDSGIRL